MSKSKVIGAYRWRDKWQQYARKLLYYSTEQGLVLLSWDGKQWRSLDLDKAGDAGPFGRSVWLVAAKDTLFRTCSLPIEVVSRESLDEAVRLDVDQWSPWGDASVVYYIPVQEGDVWNVAVWAWNGEQVNQALELLPSSLVSITHVMPEDVWMVATRRAHAWQARLDVYRSADAYRYVAIDQAGYIHNTANVNKERDAKFFLQSLGVAAEKIEAVVLHGGVSVAELPWLPECEVIDEVLAAPAPALIERGRLPGRLDWRDPLAWKPLIFAVMMMAIVWMLGSSILVWTKQQSVDEGLAQARGGGEEVLQARSTVDALALKLSAIDALDQQQKLPVLLLHELSQYLPEDVWLQSMYLKPQILEIKGQGKGAAALAGLLEKMPHVKRATYIGDIRPVPNTDQQFFGIMLYLKEGGV